MRNCKYKKLYTKVCLKTNVMFIKYILLKYIVWKATDLFHAAKAFLF